MPILVALLLIAGAGGTLAAAPQQAQPPAQPPVTAPQPAVPQQPGAPPPAAPGAAPPPATAPVPAPIPVVKREFTAPVGLIFNTVRPERVADFEKFIAYLQAALAKSTDATIAKQAAGWRVFREAEPGPNGVAVFVFVLDPTVPGADYSLGPILAEAYPDQAELTEIWKLYQNSVTSGGTLLNLTPSMPPLPELKK